MTDEQPTITPALNGAEYRATRRLSTGDDTTLAEIGETCERVPADSLPWLLDAGWIEPATASEPPPRRRETDHVAAITAPASGVIDATGSEDGHAR